MAKDEDEDAHWKLTNGFIDAFNAAHQEGHCIDMVASAALAAAAAYMTFNALQHGRRLPLEPADRERLMGQFSTRLDQGAEIHLIAARRYRQNAH